MNQGLTSPPTPGPPLSLPKPSRLFRTILHVITSRLSWKRVRSAGARIDGMDGWVGGLWDGWAWKGDTTSTKNDKNAGIESDILIYTVIGTL